METSRQDGTRRVVVTGVGAITPAGDVEQTWQAVVNGHSAIRRVTRVDLEHVPVRIGGQVPDFDPTEFFDRKDARRMPLVSQFGVVAAQRAQKDSGLSSVDLDHLGERAATVIGTTMGAHLLAEKMTSAYRSNGHQRPNPIEFANCLPNMPAHYVSRMLNLHGALHTPIAACATGTQALCIAMDLIRCNRAEVVFAGATEGILQDYIYAGFASMRALAEGYDDNPAEASRPFDADRTGFVLSEGSGVLVLESLEHALKRDANIYAEVAGGAVTSDAYHIAAIEPDARGMASAQVLAMKDAQIAPNAVRYINAHGTGTSANDKLETLAMHRAFGAHATRLEISSNKGVLGHSMAAAGAIEAILTLKTLQTGIVPLTRNLTHPDPDCDLDYVPAESRIGRSINVAMSNNFGLGGQNASIVLVQI